ncbi:DUF4817 domain-containing protein [Trichonephila clavipes]|nr:DUF4817 domain-containing protein [Trichonephila clavipes]
MVIRSKGAVEYVMVGVSRRLTQAIWRGKEIEPVQTKHFRIRSYGTQSKGSLILGGYSSVVEHSTADREVPSSNLGVPFFREVKRNIFLRISKAGMACPILYISRQSMFASETVCQVIYSQFGLAIHQNDHQARRRFVERTQNEIAVVPDFHKRILLSDEAHFWLNGYVNKQNCRIWSEANPQVYVETPLHPEKLIVCCTLWAGGINGPYFFKNDDGHNVTVNGDLCIEP